MNLTPIKANMTELDLPGGLKVLFSYKTPVAVRWTNGAAYTFYQTEKKWSQTTTRHIKTWLASDGDPGAQFKPQDYFDQLLDGRSYMEVK